MGGAAASPGYLAEHGMPLVQAITPGPMTLDQAIAVGPQLLRDAAQRLGYSLHHFVGLGADAVVSFEQESA